MPVDTPSLSEAQRAATGLSGGSGAALSCSLGGATSSRVPPGLAATGYGGAGEVVPPRTRERLLQQPTKRWIYVKIKIRFYPVFGFFCLDCELLKYLLFYKLRVFVAFYACICVGVL